MVSQHAWNPTRILSSLFNLAGLADVAAPPVCSPETFTFPPLPGTQHVATTAAVVQNYTGFPGFMHDPSLVVPPEGVRPFCNVTVSYTHPGHDDLVNLHVWVPLERGAWNGRFMGVGGGGFAAGDVDGDGPSAAVQQGYAVAVTDGGHLGRQTPPEEWGLKAPGNVNWPALFNFAYRSLHELAVIGKAGVKGFYGQEAKWSYWKGCSTGGRQGLASAQRYPGDFDGVLSMCPAVEFPAMVTALYFSQLVMREAGWWPDVCELGAVVEATVEACDAGDGKIDGIIGRLGECEFDVGSAVGRQFVCEGEKRVVDVRTVDVVRRAAAGLLDEEGRGMFPGFVPGAPMAGFLGLMNAVCEGDKCKGVPFDVTDEWIRVFIEKDPAFQLDAMSLAEYRDVFRRGVEEYDSIIRSSPDLRRFREQGGKLLMWHGMADQAITVLAGRGFYEEAKKLDQARGVKTEDYWRYFEVPGVNHCNSLHGAPFPWDALERLRKWVEEGTAPEELDARKIVQKDGKTVLDDDVRRICLYPEEGVWDGKKWNCVKPGEKIVADAQKDEL